MFTDKPYIINAQALTDTLLLTVGKPAVVGEIERDPRFALRMMAGMARRLHGLVHDVQAYALHSGLQRVIGYLLRDMPGELDAPHGLGSLNAEVTVPGALDADDLAAARPRRTLRVSLPVSKATIASRLSLTPEYFSRVLHELEGAGLIEIDKRDILIPDPGRLARYQAQ